MFVMRRSALSLLGTCLLACAQFLALNTATVGAEKEEWVRATRSGRWSDAATWSTARTPQAGELVHIPRGQTVVYDQEHSPVLRTVYIGGRLVWDPEKNTQLDVSLLRVDSTDDPSEYGFDCDAQFETELTESTRAVLEVGSAERPIQAGKTARIRLAFFGEHDQVSCPAIVCCGGRMDFHGAPLNRTWVKLGNTVKAGESSVTLSEGVSGWRVGDKIIITATRLGRDNGQGTELLETEERTITGIDDHRHGRKLQLDRPLEHEHLGVGAFRGEVANLSRNVIVESAEPAGVRGHTMYHRGSAGSISYAEFRDLGKKDVLGRYALHFHLVGDSMRGSSVIGASIHDSHNRWLTIHGTNHLVVRDCVGFRSIGHGYFMEDGTEVDNVLDRNLAVQAMHGKKLPRQVLPFDQNAGAGFWWANSRNTFTRNVSCENNRYGYFFEAVETSALKMTLPVRQPDGETRDEDIRTLPFVRFSDNEAHCDGLYGVNLGEGVNRVGPDAHHPFVLKNTRIWEVHYAFRVQAPSVLVETMTLHNSIYGVYHPNFNRHVYRDLTISRSGTSGDAEPFNRGHDDDSTQDGVLTVDGLTFSGHRHSGMPLIQITDHNPTGHAESHFRRVTVVDRKDNGKRALVDLGGGPQPAPTTPTSVPVFLHDYYGPGRHARIVSMKSGDFQAAIPAAYSADPAISGNKSRVTEVTNVEFPQPLQPVDDLPPTSVITHVKTQPDGSYLIRGTASDNTSVREVSVNGHAAASTRDNFSEWECTLPGEALKDKLVTSAATDVSGLTELTPHRLSRR